MVYLVCSAPMTEAPPETIAACLQCHWGIANRLHLSRDVIFDEDRHQLRTRDGPQVTAALRNLVIIFIQLCHGARISVTSTTRSLSRRPKRAIRLLTRPTT